MLAVPLEERADGGLVLMVEPPGVHPRGDVDMTMRHPGTVEVQQVHHPVEHEKVPVVRITVRHDEIPAVGSTASEAVRTSHPK